ncbi:MAG TPA: alpha/beta hydrolase-fold protein [Streptosporangiaceae bacterium]
MFILLLAVFGALLACVALSKQPVFRVLAASLAFLPAMLFGVAAVNKYYDYYQTWGAAAADLTGQGLSTATSLPSGTPAQRLTAILGQVTDSRVAAQLGETVRLSVTGRRSHIERTVYVFLPPQYFQAAFRNHRFPAIELISGYPGEPQDWINVVGIIQAYGALLRDHGVQPAALVMPDPNGGPHSSLQCLNIVRGPQDATYLARDLPNFLSRALRLQPSGRAWGIAGYSEGGYCAANLALRYPGRYGYAGVLSGYFVPGNVRLGHPAGMIDPFRGNSALRRENTPLDRVTALPLAARIPKFWLGAGSYDHRDVAAARAFQRLVLARQPNVVLEIEQGGAHTMATWRALVPPLLEWMTPKLAQAAAHAPPPATAAHGTTPPVRDHARVRVRPGGAGAGSAPP